MRTKGTIFHHEQLVFENGDVGIKYLVLLNEPTGDELYLCVKATSQKKDKPTMPGCIKKRSLFFIPARKMFFTKDTWLQLHELYKFRPEDIDADPKIKVMDTLSSKMIDDIVNCLFEAEGDNITPIEAKLLRPPMQEGLLKLKEMYNKNH